MRVNRYPRTLTCLERSFTIPDRTSIPFTFTRHSSPVLYILGTRVFLEYGFWNKMSSSLSGLSFPLKGFLCLVSPVLWRGRYRVWKIPSPRLFTSHGSLMNKRDQIPLTDGLWRGDSTQEMEGTRCRCFVPTMSVEGVTRNSPNLPCPNLSYG